MEPPIEPPSKSPSPLGREFLITLLGPVASMAVAAALSFSGRDLAGIGIGLSFISMLAMLICANLCAVMIGKRRGLGAGFLSFFGILAFYMAVTFAGCIAMMQTMSYR